jgi:hypothetical protein
MKQMWLVGVLAGALTLTSGAVQAQTPQGQVPTGDTALGSVTLPKAVKANGERLAAGAYQVRLKADQAQPPAPGQTPELERWVEFVRGGKVVGREVVSIVPQAEMKDLMTGKETGGRPATGGTKVESLKGDDYVRVWINRGGVNYLIHLPPA